MPDGAPAMFSQKSGFIDISKQETNVSLIACFRCLMRVENTGALSEADPRAASWTQH